MKNCVLLLITKKCNKFNKVLNWILQPLKKKICTNKKITRDLINFATKIKVLKIFCERNLKVSKFCQSNNNLRTIAKYKNTWKSILRCTLMKQHKNLLQKKSWTKIERHEMSVDEVENHWNSSEKKIEGRKHF